jgi:hypothetical protein
LHFKERVLCSIPVDPAGGLRKFLGRSYACLSLKRA